MIRQLKKQDPEKRLMIQQGEDFDYMESYTVKEKKLVDMETIFSDDEVTAVVIEYQ